MPSIKLNATTGAQSGWFDRPVAAQLLEAPPAEREAKALALPVEAVKGLGPGSASALAQAIAAPHASIRDYLAFMDRPTAGDELYAAAQHVRTSTNVVGKLYRAYEVYRAHLDDAP